MTRKCRKFRQGIQGDFQPKLAFLGRDEFNFGARQISIGSDQRQVRHGGRADRLLAEVPVHQKVVGAAVPFRAGHAQTGRGIALWIHVDEQDGQARNRERGSEINRRRGLADAAFLVRHGQDKWFSDDGPRN